MNRRRIRRRYGSYNIANAIGISGDIAGQIVIRLPVETAQRVISLFLGGEAKSEDLADGLGELANMITGNAKTQLDGKNVSISTPEVFASSDDQTDPQGECPVIQIPCECDAGNFVVDVAIKSLQGSSKAASAAT